MKRILPVLAALLAVLLLFAACDRSKNSGQEKDPNAVLTDSDIPLDLGAELIEDDTDRPAGLVQQTLEAQSVESLTDIP